MGKIQPCDLILLKLWDRRAVVMPIFMPSVSERERERGSLAVRVPSYKPENFCI